MCLSHDYVFKWTWVFSALGNTVIEKSGPTKAREEKKRIFIHFYAISPEKFICICDSSSKECDKVNQKTRQSGW